MKSRDINPLEGIFFLSIQRKLEMEGVVVEIGVGAGGYAHLRLGEPRKQNDMKNG